MINYLLFISLSYSSDLDGLYVVLFFVALFIIYRIYSYIRDYIILRKNQKAALKEKPLLDRKIFELTQITNKQYANIKELEQCIREKDNSYQNLYSINNVSIENISELYSNLLTVEFDISERYLRTKKHPAHKEAKRIAELRKDTKNYIKQFKQMQYKYEALVKLYPELTDYIDDFSVIKELNNYKSAKEIADDYDRVRNYVPKEEYLKLSIDERNQKALDRYNLRNKSNWQIGRDYEMFCAHEYRRGGCKVVEFGIEKKLKDMGRDLIVYHADGKIDVVQCKYWAQNKIIHENHIAQLYGTTIMYKIERGRFSDNKIRPVFISSIKLSETANRFADALGVLVLDEFKMGNFPQIKCNINNGNLIYHLPFDQQYDRTKIELKGEFYAYTVKEATEKGFRRAYKYYGF